MEVADESEKQQAEKAGILNQRTQLNNAYTIFTKKAQADYNAKVQDLQNEMNILKVQAQMQKDNDVEEKNKVSRETQKITVQQEIEIKDMENDCEMKMKTAMM